MQCLKAADPQREIVIVRRAGWHEVPGAPDPIFTCPDGRMIGAPDGLDVELSAASRIPVELAVGGSLKGWKRATEAALSIDGCPHWTIGTIAAFAGPSVALTGLDSCGINLSGMSSSGKSTAQRLAASAWSTPSPHPKGLAQSARTTDNAVEAMAERATGTVLCLDELAHVIGKVAARMIYTIAGGTGKRRMNADATIRDGYSWSTFAVLSGECSLEEKTRSDGGAWLAGMAIRIVDVDVSEVNRSVDAETLQRISRIEDHHGHAGPAFVRKLVEHGLHRRIDALKELTAQTGHPPADWPLVALKELMDNALDACEEAGIAPEIVVRVGAHGITVIDNGPGLSPEVVESVLDFSVRVSSREAYISPSRGAQGNALKTLVAMPFALGNGEPVEWRSMLAAFGTRSRSPSTPSASSRSSGMSAETHL